MSCQFVHVEVYARAGARSKAGGRRHSVGNILAELTREPHACSHVDNPQPPSIVFGIHPADAVAITSERASQALDKIGRKLRCDTPILLAGVVSWPVPVSKISSDSMERERYEAFRNEVVIWLRSMFGENLMSCVEHMDEAFPHIHFLVVPQLRADRRMMISDVHVGLGARKSVKDAGGDRKGCDRAYCEAMAGFQDSFHEQVAMKHGLLRLGPRRQRLSRPEWNARKQQAREFARQETKREWEAAERETRLRIEMANRERELHDRAVVAVEAMKQEMAMKAAGKARHYFEHFVKTQNDLSRQLDERESLLAEKDDELAELRALLEAHGLSTLSKKR
jgi:hypothetical protein